MINYGVFATPTMENNDLTHYLHIIHQSSIGDGVFLDGASLDAESWVQLVGGYSYVELPVAEGVHEVYSSSATFSALLTGLGDDNAGFMMNVDAG